MALAHKNKAFATFLASVFGGLGAHRFYLFGKNDFWGWAHFVTLPISALAYYFGAGRPLLVLGAFFILSMLSGFLEALVIGVTPDDKWDARHNPDSGKQSDSGWPVALLLVMTMGAGATAAIATLARAFDLFFTGGAYG